MFFLPKVTILATKVREFLTKSSYFSLQIFLPSWMPGWRRNLDSVWKVSGRCLEGVWKVSGDSLSQNRPSHVGSSHNRSFKSGKVKSGWVNMSGLEILGLKFFRDAKNFRGPKNFWSPYKKCFGPKFNF